MLCVVCCIDTVGKFGLPSCDEKRAGMMSVAWVLALLQFLLALCSLSSVVRVLCSHVLGWVVLCCVVSCCVVIWYIGTVAEVTWVMVV
jgi:hypothetical protein